MLHRQVYDVHADPSLPIVTKDSLIDTLTHYYLSRRAYVFTAVPKSMALVPRMMSMTAAVAPNFSKRHPRAAVIFDITHMMHDIISDILIVDSLSRQEKGRIIGEQPGRVSRSHSQRHDDGRAVGNG